MPKEMLVEGMGKREETWQVRPGSTSAHLRELTGEQDLCTELLGWPWVIVPCNKHEEPEPLKWRWRRKRRVWMAVFGF